MSNCAYCEQNAFQTDILNINLCTACANILNKRRPTLANPTHNAYIYARVSTKEQNIGVNGSISMQVRQCIEYCFDNNIKCIKMYNDVHSAQNMRASGLKEFRKMIDWLGFDIYDAQHEKRQNMSAFKTAIQKSKILLMCRNDSTIVTPHIDYIIVANIDRFGRDAQNMLIVRNQLSAYGTEIISAGQNIKTGNDIDNMAFNHQTFESELFSRNLSIRMKRVKSAKKAMGSFVGGSARFGSRIIKRDGKRLIRASHEEQRVLARIFKLRLQHRCYSDIAKFMNNIGLLRRGKVWTGNSIRSICANSEKYQRDEDEDEDVVMGTDFTI